MRKANRIQKSCPSFWQGSPESRLQGWQTGLLGLALLTAGMIPAYGEGSAEEVDDLIEQARELDNAAKQSKGQEAKKYHDMAKERLKSAESAGKDMVGYKDLLDAIQDDYTEVKRSINKDDKKLNPSLRKPATKANVADAKVKAVVQSEDAKALVRQAMTGAKLAESQAHNAIGQAEQAANLTLPEQKKIAVQARANLQQAKQSWERANTDLARVDRKNHPREYKDTQKAVEAALDAVQRAEAAVHSLMTTIEKPVEPTKPSSEDHSPTAKGEGGSLGQQNGSDANPQGLAPQSVKQEKETNLIKPQLNLDKPPEPQPATSFKASYWGPLLVGVFIVGLFAGVFVRLYRIAKQAKFQPTRKFYPLGNAAESTVSVHSPPPFPGDADILSAISVGETPALPEGVNAYESTSEIPSTSQHEVGAEFVTHPDGLYEPADLPTAVETSRYSGMDRQNPDCTVANKPSYQGSLGTDAPCQNEVENLNSTGLLGSSSVDSPSPPAALPAEALPPAEADVNSITPEDDIPIMETPRDAITLEEVVPNEEIAPEPFEKLLETITDLILGEIRKASEARMAAKDLCANIDAKLESQLGRRVGDCRAYSNITLEAEVAHQGWFYLLFAQCIAEGGEPRLGLLFAAPGITHSGTVRQYFDGGTLLEPIAKIKKPALVELRQSQTGLILVEKGRIETGRTG